MADAMLALPPATPTRRRELIIATAFASGGVVMVMVTLIGAYLSARNAAGAEWLANNNIPLTQPNMQLVTLVMSVFTMQWAVYSINRDDRGHTYLGLGVTLLLGAAFLNQSTFLFSQVGMEIAQPEGPLFYAVTGTHFAMVIAAMVMIVLMGLRALGGQ